MGDLLSAAGQTLDDITLAERSRLLRYCTRFTADANIAEDLVQQTLLEAWQHRERLPAPELRVPWLLGVARNVCLRWRRTAARRATRQIRLSSAGSAAPVSTDLDPADTSDPFADVERSDLAALLDRALALLPATTRAALVGRYVEDLPQAALADRLGISEGAVEARLQRGKTALRALLTTTYRDQLVAYGLAMPADQWVPTRVWCPTCGQHRLLARFAAPPGTLGFRCPGCEPDPATPRSEFRLSNAYFLREFGGLSQPRAVLRRSARWLYPYMTGGLATGWVPCTNCGRRLPLLSVSAHDGTPVIEPAYRLLAVCDVCAEGVSSSFPGIVASLPAVQQFWQQQERIRTLPLYEVEAEGGPAVVARFAAVSTAAALTVVMARAPLRLLQIHRDAESGVR